MYAAVRPRKFYRMPPLMVLCKRLRHGCIYYDTSPTVGLEGTSHASDL
jgi:hypothetical protein